MKADWKITWIDHRRTARNKPDPRYPRGVDLDMSKGQAFCTSALPYPAPRCGMYLINCNICGMNAVVTTAGRTDDPRSVKLACQSQQERMRDD